MSNKNLAYLDEQITYQDQVCALKVTHVRHKNT